MEQLSVLLLSIETAGGMKYIKTLFAMNVKKTVANYNFSKGYYQC